MNDKAVQIKNGKTRRNGSNHPTALGPVSNLEDHVHTDWWRRIFNAYYLKTDGDVVEDKALTSREADLFLPLLRVNQDARLLDLCCGQGRHTFELARRGYQAVEGLDRSHYLVNRARSRARKEGLGIRFREGDARKLPMAPDSFDAVMILGNSFGYFDTLNDDLRVLKEVRRVLKPWGKLLIDVADGSWLRGNFQPRSWEWMDENHFVCRERSLSSDSTRIISREVISRVDRGVIADQFYAERLYTRESLTDLLTTAGFDKIEFHAEIATESQRAQDLGMMARRIIATGIIKKEWSPARKKPAVAERNLVVVLGDPTKPDLLKPDARFDEDDLYTIDAMKKELNKLPGYRVTYHNSHDTLIQTLQKMPGKADLVLNLLDEGYMNDPRKELHVPSLFEVFGIPYTGAGPQCLAYCYDKSLVRGIASEMDIAVPGAFFVKSEDTTFELPFAFPAIVKPNFGDSSFGITQRSVCYDHETLINAISEIRERFGYDKPVLVEEFLTGMDLSVGVIGNPPDSYTVLPIIEEDYSALPPELPKVCGYEAKWLPDSPYWNALKSIPAELPDAVRRLMTEWCIKLFERLECRDYARFDWRLDANGNPRLLEVNPNPGWCWDGHLAKMAKFADISYGKMLEMIIKAAEKRLGMN